MDLSAITIKRNLQGFTITEIMVGVLISSILMAGVLSILSSSRRTYALQYEMALLQDNARFIMEDLTYNIRMAGYYGCSTNNPSPMNQRINGQDEVRIQDNQTNQDLSRIPIGSDSIRITTFSESLLWEEESVMPATNPITINLLSNSNVPDPNKQIDTFTEQIFISDCGGSYRYSFTVNNTNPAQGILLNLTPRTPFKIGNFVWPIEIYTAMADTNGLLMPITYEVRAIDNNDNGNAEDPEDGFALFKNSQFFVEGVENMQIRYGIKNLSDGSIIYNDTPPLINSGQEITSIRLSLLMRTAQRRGDLMNSTTQKKFTLTPDVTYDPNDYIEYEKGYRHRLFTTTIYVRNRLNPLGS